MAFASKFMTSMLAIPSELTVAAANFNLDFSLMKVEAPKEFHGVRDSLSHNRRVEAEDGQPHVTARRLGVLFENLVPPIPNLITAYGQRVSDISSRSAAAQPSERNNGIFSPQTGPDGTNIWAAATSGKGALATHLLACILARMWKSHEATSIWVELVERRKQEIADNFENNNSTDLAAMMAAKQTFHRQQLASWDSSARSWLHTADAALRQQHTQLMLIRYTGMEFGTCTMERLVQGIPQQVRDGAILLGISAWHLYPDMEILGDEIKSVHQKDELLNHALLTVPAQQVSMDREGVFWSLPLSRMRYYSPPVMAERRLASDTSRISIEDLNIIVLGAVISQWGDACPDTERGCKFIISLADLLTEPIPWLELLADAARMLVQSHGIEKKHLFKLFRLGIRRCSSFLTDTENLPVQEPFFGLSSFPNLFRVLEGMDSKLGFMRKIALDMKTDQNDLVIKYHIPCTLPQTQLDADRKLYACASAVPLARSSTKRSHRDVKTEAKGHRRWVPLGFDDNLFTGCVVMRDSTGPVKGSSSKHVDGGFRNPLGGYLEEFINDDSGQPVGGDFEESVHGSDGVCGCLHASTLQCFCEAEGYPCSVLCHPLGVGCSNQDSDVSLSCVKDCPGQGSCLNCFHFLTRQMIEIQSEECLFIHPESMRSVDYWHFEFRKPQEADAVIYDFVLGDLESIAIFQREGTPFSRYSNNIKGSPATMDEIEAIIASPAASGSNLFEYLCNWWRHTWTPDIECEQLKASFEALVFANSLYRHMMEATIDIEVINLPLYEAHWGKIKGIQSESAKLADSFACIAMFESGEFNMDSLALQGVMALSTGDSIYVASALLSDPTADTTRSPIRRVFGNLGRPEMVLLIPPSKPRLQPFDPHSWRLVNHEAFDGQLQDSFTQTSLHLSFTDFELAVDVGSRGLRDTRVVLVESLISINHRGKNIGDLDILSMFESGDLIAIQGQCECKHNSEHTTETEINSNQSPLISIDSWEEFLDFPDARGIFRATGNWEARIAGAAASIQSGKRAIILPSEPCLKCIQHTCISKQFDIIIA